MSELQRNVDRQAQEALTDIDEWFNTLVPNAAQKSTKKEIIKYNKEKKQISSKMVAIGVAVAIAVGGIAYGAASKIKTTIDTNEFNNQISSYIDQNYTGMVQPYRTEDMQHYFYNTDEIAGKIVECEDIDEAIYAAWYEMDANKEKNMDNVMIRLKNILSEDQKKNIPLSFSSYVIGLGYTDDEGKANYESYSAAMKEEIANKAGIKPAGIGK